MHNETLSRRSFIVATAAAAASGAVAQTTAIPIVDTHIHFFDRTIPRPSAGAAGGAAKGGGSGRGMAGLTISDPKVYRGVIGAWSGIVGAIEVEASPSVDETARVLDVAQTDTIMVGTIGSLEPDKPEFRAQLDRFHKNPLFRGIRYGNLWGWSLPKMVDNADFVAGMKYFASADLTLDTANPRPDLIEAVVRLTDKVPDLRVVLDHLPNLAPPEDADTRRAYENNLRELAKRKVFVKVSEVAQRVNGEVPTDLAYYKPRLDMIFDIFGEDKVVYGSDWPNSAGNWVSFEAALSLVRQYFAAKGRQVSEKYFWKNSIAAYKWDRRDPSQPRA